MWEMEEALEAGMQLMKETIVAPNCSSMKLVELSNRVPIQ
jgi:hypothetical protein